MPTLKARNFLRNLAQLTPAVVILAVGAGTVTGCTGGDSVTQPVNNVTTIPWRLNLNFKAITASIGEVVQLNATPVNDKGEALTGLPSVVYTVSDTAVHIDATGKLTGTSEASYVSVYATISNSAENWSIKDTALVSIVSTPYVFTRLKMKLDGPTLLGAGAWRNFDAVLVDALGNSLLDADGDTIHPFTLYTPSAGMDKFSLYNWFNGGGYGTALGDVTIRANAYLFGTVYGDTVNFKVTYADTATLYIYRVTYNIDPSPSMMSQTDVTVQKNGVVIFMNQNPAVTADIVFDNTTDVIGGNIASVPGYPGAGVTFPTLGKYTYHSSLGFQGTITVVNP